jgi:hypothetical protein
MLLKLININRIIFSQINLIKFTVGSLNLSTTPYRTVAYRTVPYPTVFRYNFFHARGLLGRGVPFFLPKILRFSAKNSKARTVPY